MNVTRLIRLYVVRRFGVHEWAVQNKNTCMIARHCKTRNEARAVAQALNEQLRDEQQQIAV